MLRYAIVASAALAMVSGVALAEPVGTSETTVHESPHGKVVTNRHVNHRGELVTKRKAVKNGLTGSTVSKSRTVTDPVTGSSRTEFAYDHARRVTFCPRLQPRPDAGRGCCVCTSRIGVMPQEGVRPKYAKTAFELYDRSPEAERR